LKQIFVGFLVFLSSYSLNAQHIFETDFSRTSSAEDWHGLVVDVPLEIFNNVINDIKTGRFKTYHKIPNVKPPYDYEEEEEKSWLIFYGLSQLPHKENQQGFLIQGNNHSDDMNYWIYRKFNKKKVGSLKTIEVQINISSNHARGGMGVGGRQNFDLELCLFDRDPSKNLSLDSNQHIRFPLPLKCIFIGDTAVHDEFSFNPPFKTKTMIANDIFNYPRLKNFWIAIGFHSGFEGFSGLFYENISLRFNGK